MQFSINTYVHIYIYSMPELCLKRTVYNFISYISPCTVLRSLETYTYIMASVYKHKINTVYTCLYTAYIICACTLYIISIYVYVQILKYSSSRYVCYFVDTKRNLKKQIIRSQMQCGRKRPTLKKMNM